MKKVLIVGGANGIGLSIATELSKRSDVEKLYIVDKVKLADENNNLKFESYEFDLTSEDYSIFRQFDDIDTLMITAVSVVWLFSVIWTKAISRQVSM